MSHEPESSSTSNAWLVYEFTDRYLDDLERGMVRPLEHYLALFPGHEHEIRAEHAELVAAQATTRRIGAYRLLSELGRGGQARVYLAEDTRLGRKVALKVLGATLVGASQRRRERFRREAELVARLEHPGICSVLEADLEAETPWIAMRYVEGETLAASLERERAALNDGIDGTRAHPVHGALLSERLSFFERAARALHAAHEAGVVHRDIKPGNLMVTTHGAPIVLDFGLAHVVGEESDLTRTGEVFGTPAYMAPEQLDGRASDRRTDVYALGVVVYEAVTLRRPFDAASTEALARAIRSELPANVDTLNPRLPRDLSIVLATALEKEPARRYATALELAEELRRVREFEPIRARPVGVLGRLARWSKRQPIVAGATVGSIVLLSAALIAALFFIAELRAQRNAKQQALSEKQAALALYEGAWFRDLAAQRVEISPAEGLRLAIAAAERDPGLASNRALLAALAELRERATLAGHDDVITQIDVCAANGCIASASMDATARIWDASSGSTLAVLRGHAGPLWCVRFDRSGERVVTASSDGTARVWSWRDAAAAPVVLGGHGAEVEWAEFSADGAHVVTGSRDRSARTWNAASGACELVLPGGEGNVSSAQFIAHDRCVLTASGETPWASPAPESDHTLRLFDASTGARVALLDAHGDSIRRVVPHPDGRRFLSTSDDASARLWDLGRLRDGAIEATHVFKLPGYCAAGSFSPDGERLALAFESGARVFDVESGALLHEFADHDHRAVIDIAFDPSGTLLATAAFDNTVRVFDAASAAQLALYRGVPTRPRGVLWGPGGGWLASWHTTPDAKVWYGAARPFLPVLAPHAGALASARYDPSGSRIVTACADGRARVFDAASGALLQCIDPAPEKAQRAESNDGARSPLRCADYDARGARLVATDDDGVISVLRAHDGALERTLRGQPGAPVAAFVADGKWLLYVAASGEPRLEALDGALTCRLTGAKGHVISLQPDPAGDSIACGTDERTLHVWRLASPPASGDLACAWSFGPYEEQNHRLNSIYDVAFSPDGQELAATTQNLKTHLFDAHDGRALGEDVTPTIARLIFSRDGRHLFGCGKWTGFVRAYRVGPAGALGGTGLAATIGAEHALQKRDLRDAPAWIKTASFLCVARAPARNLIAAGSLDRTAKLWDLDAGECVAVYPGHDDAVADVDFAPDGASFVTASADGTARIWPVDVLATARAAAPRGNVKPIPLPQPQPRTR